MSDVWVHVVVMAPCPSCPVLSIVQVFPCEVYMVAHVYTSSVICSTENKCLHKMCALTLLHFKWITSKDRCRAQGLLWQPGGGGEQRMGVYVWLRAFAVHIKLLQHCSLTALV